MKIYFDARMIDHPGIGRYIRCLIKEIAKDDSVDLCLLGNKEKIKRLLSFEAEFMDFNYPIYSIQEQIGFLKLKKIIKNDILHVPHYNVPALVRFNLVSTVHDLIHIVYPEGASGRFAPMYMRLMMNRILKTASGIICVSEATKKALEGIKKDGPVEVIYEGIDGAFRKIDDKEFLDQVRKKYKLPEKFLLYVGSIRRHKNICALLDSFSQFKKKMPEARLVMVGRLGQDIDIKRDGVIYLGEIESDKELAAIYNLASCLFNLSLHEGFGLTILEAQSCGLPVVCSDIPVHREIGEDGILPVNPSYIDQVCKNLYNVLFDNGMREALIAKGLENIRRFDWQNTANATVELYRKIYNAGSDSSRLAFRDAGRGENP